MYRIGALAMSPLMNDTKSSVTFLIPLLAGVLTIIFTRIRLVFTILGQLTVASSTRPRPGLSIYYILRRNSNEIRHSLPLLKLYLLGSIFGLARPFFCSLQVSAMFWNKSGGNVTCLGRHPSVKDLQTQYAPRN